MAHRISGGVAAVPQGHIGEGREAGEGHETNEPKLS